MDITTSTYHTYYSRVPTWLKWRLTYTGGRDFIDKYLRKFSTRETDDDFNTRSAVTYSPSFAKAALIDIGNSIFQRGSDITRADGHISYQRAVEGLDGGVTFQGHSMNSFIGQQVLPELLSMGEVGVYVDMPDQEAETLAEIRTDTRPYLYIYKIEDIRNYRLDRQGRIVKILLQNYVTTYDDAGLPDGEEKQFRLMEVMDGSVDVTIYDSEGRAIEQHTLDLATLPFVHFKLNRSLLADVADYQIALLNLASSDLNVIGANFPFYTEQQDTRADLPQIKEAELDADNDTVADRKEKQIGPNYGVSYSKGTERPGFIHPSPEPLRVSMEKQKQMKDEIRELINLAIISLQPRLASAESKAADNLGLEAGLSYVGLELEHGEREISDLWASYMNAEPATIQYPRRYSLKSETERREEIKQLLDVQAKIPSLLFQQSIAKRVVTTLLGDKLSATEFKTILDDIDQAQIFVTDPEIVLKYLETSIVSPELISTALGFPKGEVEKAEKAHARRLARLAIAQTEGAAAARGVADAGDPNDGRDEKTLSRDTDQDEKVTKKVRGDGK